MTLPMDSERTGEGSYLALEDSSRVATDSEVLQFGVGEGWATTHSECAAEEPSPAYCSHLLMRYRSEQEYSMRAAELIATRTFRLTDMPLEDPGPGEVQVRIEAVGVCGSDLHAYSEGVVGSTPNVYPMVLGHEPAGRIVKTGAGVTGLAVGDRGALEPALLLSLRILLEGSPQRVREHSLSE